MTHRRITSRADCGSEMQLYLTDEEALALLDLLNTALEGNGCPVSPRIRTLRGTLAKLGSMTLVLEERRRVKAEVVEAAEAEIDRQELERELRSGPSEGGRDRRELERELWWSGPEGAAAAWGQVDAGLRTERARLDRLREGLPADPLDAPSWASELCGAAAKWWAWESVRLRGDRDGGRTWAALEAAEADLRETLTRGSAGGGDPAHGGLMAVALDLVLRELDKLIGAHRAAVAGLYARAHRAGFA
jgi:hypothetical protein